MQSRSGSQPKCTCLLAWAGLPAGFPSAAASQGRHRNFMALKSNPGRSDFPQFRPTGSQQPYFPVIASWFPAGSGPEYLSRCSEEPAREGPAPCRGLRRGQQPGLDHYAGAVGAWGWSSLGWTSLNARQGVVASSPSSFAWQLPQIGICWSPHVSIAASGWPQPLAFVPLQNVRRPLGHDQRGRLFFVPEVASISQNAFCEPHFHCKESRPEPGPRTYRRPDIPEYRQP